MTHSDPRAGLPLPIDTGPSPLLPQHLVDLFLRPSRFFSGQLALGKTPYAVLVIWFYGAATAIDRVDRMLLREQIGQPRPGWDKFAPYIVGSWLGFWLLILIFGALNGLFLWWVSGWWFAVRVRWSGIATPDRRLARLVMAYSAFVEAGPVVVAVALSGLFFGSYAEAYSADESYSLILLIFPFWSAAVGYSGVRAAFGASGWRPRLWFLILPCIVYIVAMGLGAVLFGYLAEQRSV